MTGFWIATLKMADRVQQTWMRLIESQTHVSVWNAIRYLDSPTDYREHLTHKSRFAPLQGGEFVLLDAPGWTTLLKLTAIIVLLCTILLLLLLRT
jgi:hypothetical protein